MRKIVAAATGTLLIALVTACGSGTESSDDATTAESPDSAVQIDAAPAPATVDLRIAAGEVTPTNLRVDATVGEPIVIRVNSDVADELHIHSEPEHSFEVKPNLAQEFEFTVDVPGQVAVELHEAGVTVATLQVRP